MDKNAYLKQWRQEYEHLEKKGYITLAEAAKNEDFKKEWKAYPNKKKPKKTTKKTPEPPRKEPSSEAAAWLAGWKPKAPWEPKVYHEETPEQEAWNSKLRNLPSRFEHKIDGEVGDGNSRNMTLLVETTTGLLFGLLVNGVVVLIVEMGAYLGQGDQGRYYRDFAVYFGTEMEDGAKWMNKELGPLTYWNKNANYLVEASQPKLKEILNRGHFDGDGPYKTGLPPKEIANMFYSGGVPDYRKNVLYADVREGTGMYKRTPSPPRYVRPKSAYDRFIEEGYGD
jgi:hypothetical protein